MDTSRLGHGGRSRVDAETELASAIVAGGAAIAAGKWDEAVAELETGLELAQVYDSSWMPIAVGLRAYVEAHRGQVDAAHNRLDAFCDSGLSLPFGPDLPGLAALAVLEAEGARRAAVTLARKLWAAASARGEAWTLALAPEVARVALAGMERELLARVAAQVAESNAPQNRLTNPTTAFIRGLTSSDREAVERAAEGFVGSGSLMAAAHAREEYACLAAAEGDRGAAVAAMERAHVTYDRAGAVVDCDRLLSRLRALGVRRGLRSAHRTAVTGWAALTPTEQRVADLVRTGRTNPEIAARLFVSPRTVQTHVSHILAKLGVRSRVDIARVQVT